MATFTKLEVGYDSVSGTGEPINITAISPTGPATTIHTITEDAEEVISITATNTSATDEIFTIQIGGTAVGDRIVNTISGNSSRVVLARHPLKATGGNLVITAYSATTGVVNVIIERWVKTTLNTTT